MCRRLKEAGAPLHPRIDSELANHLGFVDGALKGRDFFVGHSLTGADIQMSFVGEMAKVFEKLGPYPNLAAWLARMHARPAFQRRGEGRGVPVCVRTSISGRAVDPGISGLPALDASQRPGMTTDAAGQAPAQGRGYVGGRGLSPSIPTISCINISPVPQVLGQFRPMWYLAGASFDRHT